MKKRGRDYWRMLGEHFDETLERRSAIMLKPADGSRHFAWPMPAGQLGWQMDAGMFAGYEEDPYLSCYLAEWYYPSVYGDFSGRSPIAVQRSKYFPDLTRRQALLPNVGLEVDETFCRPVENAFQWVFNVTSRGSYNMPRRIFIVFEAPRLKSVRRDAKGFSFTPDRAELKFDANEKVVKTTPNQGVDARSELERERDPLPGNLPFYLAVDASGWGVYATGEALADAFRSGKLNAAEGDGRYLALAFDLFPKQPTPNAWTHKICPREQAEIRLGIGLRNGEAASAARVAVDPERAISTRWNRWFNALPAPPTADRRILKAYAKCRHAVALNRYDDPRFGTALLESPVYSGYWICNQPTAELVSRQDPADRGHSFREVTNLFCRHMSSRGAFPHAMYLKEKTPGEIWNASHVGSIPNMAWSVYAYYEKSGDAEAIRNWYPSLLRNYAFFQDYRDTEKLGLWHIVNVHDSFDVTPLTEKLRNRQETYYYSAEYAAEKITTERALSKLAAVLGLDNDAARFASAAEKTLKALNDFLWDAAAGWFAARHQNGEKDARISVGGLFPLAYGLATIEQAAAAEKNARKLMSEHGFRTFASNQDGYYENYWRGPVWATSVLYGAMAVANYYPNLAAESRRTLVNYCLSRPGIWELLEGDSGRPAATDWGFVAGVVYGGPSLCGAAALIAALDVSLGGEFFPKALRWPL